MKYAYIGLLLVFIITSCVDANAMLPDQVFRTDNVEQIRNERTSTLRDVSAGALYDLYVRDGVPGGNHTGFCDDPNNPDPHDVNDGCEADHRCSLQLGCGNSTDKTKPGYLNNLALQRYWGPCNAHHKDKLENKLHLLIIRNQIIPIDAQDLIYYHWEDGYKRYIDAKGCQ